MAHRLTILYRGPLASCNYRCGYCPFAKRRESPAQEAADRQALARFCDWAAGCSYRLAIFFTPWGEALVRPWYQEAMVALTHLANVSRVAVQTNLACRLDWLDRCDRRRLAVWCTYHPGQVSRTRFLDRCRRLDVSGIRYSVGLVALREHLAEAEVLRQDLLPQVYLWGNAYKDVPDYYSEDDIRQWEAIDPLFRINLRPLPSFGRLCRAGSSVIAVDGDGTIRRCHFIKQTLGNLYQSGPPQSQSRHALHERNLWLPYRLRASEGSGAMGDVPRRRAGTHSLPSRLARSDRPARGPPVGPAAGRRVLRGPGPRRTATLAPGEPDRPRWNASQDRSASRGRRWPARAWPILRCCWSGD